MQKRVQITIKGRVQGVFFRAYTEKEAKALDLVGFVKNQADGSVFVDAQGELASLNTMIQWCQKGSPLSHVAAVTTEYVPIDLHFHRFEITR